MLNLFPCDQPFPFNILLAFNFELIVWKMDFFLSIVHASKERKRKGGDETKLFDTLIPFHQSNRFLSSFDPTRFGCINFDDGKIQGYKMVKCVLHFLFLHTSI